MQLELVFYFNVIERLNSQYQQLLSQFNKYKCLHKRKKWQSDGKATARDRAHAFTYSHICQFYVFICSVVSEWSIFLLDFLCQYVQYGWSSNTNRQKRKKSTHEKDKIIRTRKNNGQRKNILDILFVLSFSLLYHLLFNRKCAIDVLIYALFCISSALCVVCLFLINS